MVVIFPIFRFFLFLLIVYYLLFLFFFSINCLVSSLPFWNSDTAGFKNGPPGLFVEVVFFECTRNTEGLPFTFCSACIAIFAGIPADVLLLLQPFFVNFLFLDIFFLLFLAILYYIHIKKI